MLIDRQQISHHLLYERGCNQQRTIINGASSDKELTDAVRKVFHGRFRRPDTLHTKDGVKLTIKRIDHRDHTSRVVFCSRIYNKSPLQARQEFEQAIIRDHTKQEAL